MNNPTTDELIKEIKRLEDDNNGLDWEIGRLEKIRYFQGQLQGRLDVLEYLKENYLSISYKMLAKVEEEISKIKQALGETQNEQPNN